MKTLTVLFPNGSQGQLTLRLTKLQQEVTTHRSSIEEAKVTLNWRQIEWGRDMHRVAFELMAVVKSCPNLKKVDLIITQPPRMRIQVRNTLGITQVLELFREELVSLYVEGTILEGNLDGFMENLSAARKLQKLHLESFSFLPDKNQRYLPALFRTVASLPNIRACRYSKQFDFLVAEPRLQHEMVSSLVQLVQRRTLNTLELRIEGDYAFIPHIAHSMCDKTSSIRHLILSTPRHSDPSRFKEIYQSLGTMISNNTTLKTLELYVSSKPGALDAVLPVTQALERNRSLENLIFHRRARGDNHPQTIPDAFCNVLRNQNCTLKNLKICGTKYTSMHQRPMSIALPLPAELNFYLKLNTIGRDRLVNDLHHTSTRDDWSQMIMKRKDEVDVVYYFLRLNPDLLIPSSTCLVAAGNDEDTLKRTLPPSNDISSVKTETTGRTVGRYSLRPRKKRKC